MIRSLSGSLQYFLGCALCVAAPAASWAGDGVIEINQAKALAGEVTPGDAEGFPVTISESGSYRLTGDLTVPDENTSGIEIGADNVTVDLNGFAVSGPTVCTGTTATCDPLGTGIGIDAADATGAENTTILSGIVQGMGSQGIKIRGGRIEGVHVVSNGGAGILALPVTYRGAVIRGNRALSNGGAGISTEGSIVTENVASNNGKQGIGGGTSNISKNVVRGNGSIGILTSAGKVVGNLVFGNGGHGIQAQGGSVVQGNMVSFSLEYGLNLDADTGYSGNVLKSNANTVMSGVSMGENVCNGNTTCP